MKENFIDSTKIKKPKKDKQKVFRDSNIDTSHYRVNSPRIIKSISIDF